MIDYTIILTKKYPNAKWILNGDDYSGLEWLDDSPKPTKKSLDDSWDSIILEIKNEEAEKASQKTALLNRLGITAEEAKLLLS